MIHTYEAVAWTLIHFTWQAAAIAGLYRLASIATASSRARYTLAVAALLAMLASAAVTFTWELRAGQPMASLSGITGARSGAPLLSEIPTTAERADIPETPALLPMLASLARTEFALVIDALWLIGIVVLSLRSLGGWWLLHRLRATAKCAVPPQVEAAFRRIVAAAGLKRKILLRVSTAISGPMTMGALRSAILLPLSTLTALGPDEIEAVLAHELAHIRRADYLWNLLQTLAETLFFFHPAVWWINRRIRAERELCCDDLALELCPNRIVYASALYHLEEQRIREQEAPRFAMALGGPPNGPSLTSRIARILNEEETTLRLQGETHMKQSNMIRPFSLVGVALGLAVVMLSAPQLVSGLRPQQQQQTTTQNTTQTTTQTQTPATSAPAPAAPAAPTEGVSTPSDDMSVPVPEPAPAPAAVTVSVPSVPDPPADVHVDADPDIQMDGNAHTITSEQIKAMKAQRDAMRAQLRAQLSPEKLKALNDEAKKSLDDAHLYFDQGKMQKLMADARIAQADAARNFTFANGIFVNGFANDYSKPDFTYIDKMKAAGYGDDLDKLIGMKAVGITPEYAQKMNEAGFGKIPADELMGLRAQGVTPEFAAGVKREFPQTTIDNLHAMQALHINGDFIAAVKQHGYTNVTLDQLIKLRVTGLLDR